MDFTIRNFDPETDIPALAALESLCESSPVTEDEMRNQDSKWGSESVRCRLVATLADGRVCGYAEAGRRVHVKPGQFRIWVIVAREMRLQGIGALLYQKVHEFALANRATFYKSQVRDNDPLALRFAEKRGFNVTRHKFESVLALETFDSSRFAGVVETLQAEGIRFFSFADTNGSEEDQRKLYEINTLLGHDVPGNELESVRPFEQFAADVFGGHWFQPDGQIFAAVGDRLIGLGAAGIIHPGVGYNLMTGVLREYRGRGIALALKLLCIEFCQKHDLKSIRTHNDSQNQSILAINRKLGYRAEPGWFTLRCDLE